MKRADQGQLSGCQQSKRVLSGRTVRLDLKLARHRRINVAAMSKAQAGRLGAGLQIECPDTRLEEDDLSRILQGLGDSLQLHLHRRALLSETRPHLLQSFRHPLRPA